MRFFETASLKRKQMLIIMLTTSVALLLACIAFAIYETTDFRNDMVENLSTLAKMIGDSTSAALDFRDPASAEEALSVLRNEPDIMGACVFTKENQIFARYDRANGGRSFAPPEKFQVEGHSFGGGRLTLFEPVISKGEIIGAVCLESDMRSLHSRLERSGAIVSVVFILTAAVALLLSIRLQRLISEPLLHLVQTARTVAREKNYSVRARKYNPDEIGQLTDGFNEMLAQIQERDANLERRVNERTQELAKSLSLLNATLGSTADGILVVSGGKKVLQNRRTAELWKIPPAIADSDDNNAQVRYILDAVVNPEKFLKRIRHFYSHPDEQGWDEIELRDGTVMERITSPVLGDDGKDYGRIWTFRDVTERKRAHELLLRTEQIYRQAIAGAGAVPYSYNYHTRTYSFIGAGVEELIGYTPAEMKPAVWDQITQESIMLGECAGMEKAAAVRKARCSEMRHWRCDMRVITRTGKSRWIADASVQNYDEAGRPIGSMGILQDITERKHAELVALAFSKLGRNLSSAASREEAARIIGDVAYDLFRWDAFWVHVYSEKDDTVCSIYDVDTIDGEQIIGRGDRPRKATEFHHRLIEHGAELLLRDAAGFVPGTKAFGDISRPSASLMFASIRFRDRVVGLLSVQSYTRNAYSNADLNILQTLGDHCAGALERIRFDDERRESESQFKLVWDTSADGMRLADREGKVVMVNDAYCRMVEKSKAEIEGRSLAVAHCQANAGPVLERHREKIDSNRQHSRVETEVTLWNGRKVWLELSNSILRRPGKPTLLLSILRDVTQRKIAEDELQRTHRQLLDASRQAGMAEVATNVLHNVGNVLNSVNVSATLVIDQVKRSKAASLKKLAALIETHAASLGAFLTTDARGRQIPAFLSRLADYLLNEQQSIFVELQTLRKNIEHIKEIVVMQQDYARVCGVAENVKITHLVEDALRMNAGALARHHVEVTRDYQAQPVITVEKHKVLQILVNLIRNAKYACSDSARKDKRLTLRICEERGRVRIAVMDNGVGIPPENLIRIFSHGFTTRKNGHGFGLHGGALAARELGGELKVESEGIGKGATFILELPFEMKPQAA